MKNTIGSSIGFQASLDIVSLGRNNTKMKKVAEKFKESTSEYPNDRLLFDPLGFALYPHTSRNYAPLSDKGLKFILKQPEEKITKACVKIFIILKYLDNKWNWFYDSAESFYKKLYKTIPDKVLDKDKTKMLDKTYGDLIGLVKFAEKTEIENMTKTDELLKHIDYTEL